MFGDRIIFFFLDLDLRGSDVNGLGLIFVNYKWLWILWNVLIFKICKISFMREWVFCEKWF